MLSEFPVQRNIVQTPFFPVKKSYSEESVTMQIQAGSSVYTRKPNIVSLAKSQMNTVIRASFL